MSLYKILQMFVDSGLISPNERQRAIKEYEADANINTEDYRETM